MTIRPSTNEPEPANDRLTRLLADLWVRNQPVIHARLDLLDRTCLALQCGTLSPPQQQEAHATAHQLAGMLGMYGFPQGTEIARLLEQAYDTTVSDLQTIQTLTTRLRLSVPPR